LAGVSSVRKPAADFRAGDQYRSARPTRNSVALAPALWIVSAVLVEIGGINLLRRVWDDLAARFLLNPLYRAL
jgi:hypothetical protein